MTYSRVLGTIGLIGATVLGAMGPARVSQAAPANARTPRHLSASHRLSATAAKQAALKALRVGYITTRNGKRVYLSSALTNNFHGVGGAKASGAVSAGHANASTPPTINGGVRANQDFGFYLTGNGQLFHNTESVAVDPVSPIHVVVSATDTRLGSDSSIFNLSSNPILSGTFNPTCFGPALVPTPCALIQALGGPGIYNSTDGAHSFTDLVIPDTITGAVPDAINTAACPQSAPGTTANAGGTGFTGTLSLTDLTGIGCPLPAGVDPDAETADSDDAVGVAEPTTGPDADSLTDSDVLGPFAPQIQATIACIPASETFVSPAVLQQTPGVTNGCVPYDSVGDQSVAFDTTGALYSVSLGLVSIDPLARTDQTFVDAPQTDVLLNVSPAIQPVGAAVGASLTNQPNAAGRVFNNTPPTPTCNPNQSSTTVCLHNEVIASSASSNFLQPSDNTVFPVIPSAASVVGRNWQADDAFRDGFGLCDNLANARSAFGDDVTSGDLCLIDTPYLAINGVVDPTAYVTYSVYDFSQLSSNIYLTTALVNGAGNGTLPIWTAPVSVDNAGFASETGNGNPFCPSFDTGVLGGPAPFLCSTSWGAEPTVGPDGAVYIAYENGDLTDLTNCPAADCNQILVATATQPTFTAPTANVGNQSFAATVVDHDAYQSAVVATTDPIVANDPAGLDPASGAYFTIPNRPTIAVTAPVTLNGVTYSGGLLIVAWTDQRSFPGKVLNYTSGTRVWYTLGAAKSSQALVFNVLNKVSAPTGFMVSPTTIQPTDLAGGHTYVIAEAYEPNVVANQFFPWVTASQFAPGPGVTIPDNVFIGFYQEIPGKPATLAPASPGTPASLAFYVAKSQTYGADFSVNPATTNMPLPTTPVSQAYCATFGFTNDLPGLAACNAVPYFGTYTGIAWDKNNGAYVSWTDTRPNSRNFQVGGSQDVFSAHVS